MKQKIFLIFFLLSSKLFASFENVGVGARPSALSGAYSAISDDIYATLYNPAGINFISQMQLGAQFSRLYPNLTDKSNISQGFLGFAYPFKKEKFGSLGFTFLQLSLDTLYKENSLIISYSNKIPKLKSLNLGLNLKSLGLSYGRNIYDIETTGSPIPQPSAATKSDPLTGKSKSTISLDLGLIYKLGANYKLAFAIKDLNQPDIGVGEKSALTSTYDLGFLYKLESLNISGSYQMKKFASKNDTKYLIGAEYKFPFELILRGGLGFGSRSYKNISAGFGYNFKAFEFNYAFQLPLSGLKNTFGIHRVDAIVRFGPVVREVGVEKLKKELEAESLLRRKTESELNTVKDQLKKREKEIELLRNQLADLLKKKIEVPPPVTPPPTPPTPTPSPEEKLKIEYNKSLDFYRKRSLEGASLKERIFTIEKIIGKYKGKVDVSEVESELKSLKDKQFEFQKSYDASMLFYQNMVKKGISKEERIKLLERVVEKFKDSGIDISQTENELNELKK